MPKVKVKGKVKHFPYTKRGKAMAKKTRMKQMAKQIGMKY